MTTLKVSIQFTWIFLALLPTVCVTWGTIVTVKYKELQEGHNITGAVAVELIARSKIQCSDR